jgi:hypothetical protein
MTNEASMTNNNEERFSGLGIHSSFDIRPWSLPRLGLRIPFLDLLTFFDVPSPARLKLETETPGWISWGFYGKVSL